MDVMLVYQITWEGKLKKTQGINRRKIYETPCRNLL